MTTKDPIAPYVVVSEITYACLKRNPGEVIHMPASRAEKFLSQNAIAPAPTTEK